jgi:uncharacterized secreted protein with C-terminal beta-propeller domain
MESLEARQLMSGALWNPSRVWIINGDQANNAPNDAIVVTYNAATRALDLTVNGQFVESQSASRVRGLIINAGTGDDTVWVDTGHRAIPITVYAGDGNDQVVTAGGRDALYGGAGDDRLTAGGGNDLLDGEAGNDLLLAGAGNDRLYGGTGDDTLVGGEGKDWFDGGAGADTVYAVKRDRRIADQADTVTVVEDPMLTLAGPAGQTPTLTTPTRTAPQFAPARYLELENTPGYPAPVHYTGELRQRLIDEAVARYKDKFDTTTTSTYWDDRYYLYGGVNMAFDAAVPRAVAATASTDHSTTNTQVAGVDEADLVETDGNFIYTIRGHQLLVIDVRTQGQEHIAAIAQLDSSMATGIYLVGNRLVVLSYDQAASSSLRISDAWLPSKAVVWTFDVSDPTSPVRLKTTTFTGIVSESRVVGDQLYLVVSNNLSLPAPQTTLIRQGMPSQPAGNPLVVTATYTGAVFKYQSEDEYRAWLEAHIDDYLPRYATMAGDSTTAVAQGSLLDDFWELHEGEALGSVMTVVTLDLQGDTSAPVDMVTTPGAAQVVYASQDTLYVCNTRSTDFFASKTEILKFTLGAGSVQLVAGGEVAGRVSNAYAMDEKDGRLRVVTEEWANGQRSHSLFVLDDTGSSLAVVGAVGGFGLNETVRSVLFSGDRAFVVTFRQTDPLFAIDLSAPENPVVVGELVMPGYSTYLYPVDANHLVGIGVGVSAETGRLSALQISLYDVTDLANPILRDQKLYENGWNGVSSLAQYDPHAFAYFAGKGPVVGGGILAIPTSRWGENGQNMLVLALDPANGFTELGQVAHTSEVQRAVRIGGNLYSVASTSLKIVDLLDPSKVFGEVVLPAIEPDYRWVTDFLPVAASPPVLRIFASDTTVIAGATSFSALQPANTFGSGLTRTVRF